MKNISELRVTISVPSTREYNPNARWRTQLRVEVAGEGFEKRTKLIEVCPEDFESRFRRMMRWATEEIEQEACMEVGDSE